MELNMRKLMKKFFIWLAILTLILLTHPLWMPLPAKFLVVKDNIAKADAVVVLSGAWDFDREAKAIELYKKGNADKIIRILEKENIGFDVMKKLLNSDATQEEAYEKFFELNGAGKESVILGKAVATSTFDELTAVKGIVLKNHFRSIILVTGDYHMRRTIMTAKWVFRSNDIKVYHATVYSKGFNANKWWLHERSIKEVILEYLNSCFYLIYHFMLGK